LGFIGVLIIIRPGFQELNPGVFYALGAGTMSALYILLTKHLTASVSPIVTTFQTSLIGAVVLSFAMLWTWHDVSLHQWSLLVALGFFAILGHYFITKAYNYGEASLLSPLGYTEMDGGNFWVVLFWRLSRCLDFRWCERVDWLCNLHFAARTPAKSQSFRQAVIDQQGPILTLALVNCNKKLSIVKKSGSGRCTGIEVFKRREVFCVENPHISIFSERCNMGVGGGHGEDQFVALNRRFNACLWVIDVIAHDDADAFRCLSAFPSRIECL
jgi:hypothetical protein